jgi:dihydropteroate synthase
VSARLYIRPVGRLPPAAPDAQPGATLALGGRADQLFAAAEVIERDGSGAVRRRTVRAEELAQFDAAAPVLQRLQQRRPAIAGIGLDRTRLMGVVNVTPDSFSDGGQFFSSEAAVAHGLQLEAEGADMLDVGGESTRPGAEAIGLEEECRRVLPVIEALARRARVPVSIDTRNAEVMRRAAAVGARIINDVSALTHDPASLGVAARTGLPVVLMHAQGDPRTMQHNPTYADVGLDVYDMLEARIDACVAAGIARERLVVDPGIGFGKTLVHNLALLGALTLFQCLGCAVLLGVSRKSFIAKLTGAAPDERLPGSLAGALLGAGQGVQILRVHDVAATRQALAVWEGADSAKSGA